MMELKLFMPANKEEFVYFKAELVKQDKRLEKLVWTNATDLMEQISRIMKVPVSAIGARMTDSLGTKAIHADELEKARHAMNESGFMDEAYEPEVRKLVQRKWIGFCIKTWLKVILLGGLTIGFWTILMHFHVLFYFLIGFGVITLLNEIPTPLQNRWIHSIFTNPIAWFFNFTRRW